MKSELLYLHHIRERCERVASCVQAGKETFFGGGVIYQDAVMRNLEIIGGAAKIYPALRAQLPWLPWRQISGLRDIPDHTHVNLRRHLLELTADLGAVWQAWTPTHGLLSLAEGVL
jgi:uncharacterized protein with HEPN domain